MTTIYLNGKTLTGELAESTEAEIPGHLGFNRFGYATMAFWKNRYGMPLGKWRLCSTSVTPRIDHGPEAEEIVYRRTNRTTPEGHIVFDAC